MNGGVGSRRILKSARMQPLEIHWETVIAFPLVTLYLDRKIGLVPLANTLSSLESDGSIGSKE